MRSGVGCGAVRYRRGSRVVGKGEPNRLVSRSGARIGVVLLLFTELVNRRNVDRYEVS